MTPVIRFPLSIQWQDEKREAQRGGGASQSHTAVVPDPQALADLAPKAWEAGHVKSGGAIHPLERSGETLTTPIPFSGFQLLYLRT